MKKIGFIDYYLDEWHANNYPVWIDEYNRKHGTDFKVACAYGETEFPPRGGLSSSEWCARFGAEECRSVEEVCEKCDYIMILAPSDPDKHLFYAQRVFPYKKPVYVDKTFAPDYRSAAEIFALGEKYGTPFFSTSSLRCAEEIADTENAFSATVTGGGSDFDEYVVHIVEMTVKIMGMGAVRVQSIKKGEVVMVNVFYGDGRSAEMVYSVCEPYSVTVKTRDGKHFFKKIESDYFAILIARMMDFFVGKPVFFDTRQTLEVMKIREAAIESLKNNGSVVKI